MTSRKERQTLSEKDKEVIEKYLDQPQSIKGENTSGENTQDMNSQTPFHYTINQKTGSITIGTFTYSSIEAVRIAGAVPKGFRFPEQASGKMGNEELESISSEEQKYDETTAHKTKYSIITLNPTYITTSLVP